MTRALAEALAVIGEADSSPQGSAFGRIPHERKRSLDDRYIYLRFKHDDGQPMTYVRVKVD